MSSGTPPPRFWSNARCPPTEAPRFLPILLLHKNASLPAPPPPPFDPQTKDATPDYFFFGHVHLSCSPLRVSIRYRPDRFIQPPPSPLEGTSSDSHPPLLPFLCCKVALFGPTCPPTSTPRLLLVAHFWLYLVFLQRTSVLVCTYPGSFFLQTASWRRLEPDISGAFSSIFTFRRFLGFSL